MKVVVDEETDEILVEIDKAFIVENCRFGSPTNDQFILLGLMLPWSERPASGWLANLVGTRIPLGAAKALVALGRREAKRAAYEEAPERKARSKTPRTPYKPASYRTKVSTTQGSPSTAKRDIR